MIPWPFPRLDWILDGRKPVLIIPLPKGDGTDTFFTTFPKEGFYKTNGGLKVIERK
jgi:hypothetical protein